MTTPNTPANIAYGAASVFSSVDEAKQLYDTLAKHPDVKEIDTARSYGDSERWIGELGLARKYITTTKAPTFYDKNNPGRTKETILSSAKESWKQLRVDKVAVYLLHSPDTSTPFEEQLEAVQQLYLEGRFEKFGISNFSPAQVQEIHAIASQKGYVLPTVYQGSYSLLSRHLEHELFPILRSLNIAFQAYAPIAGGFLVKTPEFIANPPDGSRWDRRSIVGKMYQFAFNKPELLNYLEEYIQLSKETGLSQAEIAYRWARFHGVLDGANRGDSIIFGANNAEQLQETLEFLEKGPLGEDVVSRLEAMWERVKHVAPHHDTMLHGFAS